MTDHHAELPAATNALNTIELVPALNGALAVQVMVPVAVPPVPLECDHRTAVTPTLSVAMPLKVMVGADGRKRAGRRIG